MRFDIDVKRPPRDDNLECSIKFDGKAKTDLNVDMCLFLDDWADARENYSSERYADWKDKTTRLLFAVISTHAGRNPLLIAFFTDLKFDHAAQ